MAGLAAAMRTATGAVDACDLALAKLRPATGSRAYDDDTALLALATHPESGDLPAPAWLEHSQTLELPADATSPGRARVFVADLLERWGLDSLVDACARGSHQDAMRRRQRMCAVSSSVSGQILLPFRYSSRCNLR